MIYPFLLYSPEVRHAPVFPHLQGDPCVIDLSTTSPLLEDIDVRDQVRLQELIEEKLRPHYHWGLSPYLERRETLLGSCPQMVAEKRFIHLGLDVIVRLGALLHAPLDATVAQSGYESGEGNYGGFVLLEHASSRFTTFYSFYGHLCKDRLPAVGRFVSAGEAFAQVGDFQENGNWFYHTHIQVITGKGLEAGYVSKGYCADEDMAEINELCPSPIPLFTVNRGIS